MNTFILFENHLVGLYKTKIKEKMVNVGAFLAEQQAGAPRDVVERWAVVEQLLTKKLWHQLTLELLQLLRHPYFQTNKKLGQIYSQFIVDFEHRINPLSLAEIVHMTCLQIECNVKLF